MNKLNFKDWLVETGAIYDGTRGTFNWWGAPGSVGKIIDGWPIGTKEDKKETKRKKKA